MPTKVVPHLRKWGRRRATSISNQPNSGVYFTILILSPPPVFHAEDRQCLNFLHPIDIMSGSLFLRICGYHLCFFILTLI